MDWANFERPIYVKASSMAEARRELGAGGAGTPDYSPSHPDMTIGGRGRIAADQEYVQALAEERGDA